MQIKSLLLLSALCIAGTQAKCEHFDESEKWGVRLYGKKDCIDQVQSAQGDYRTKCNNLDKAATSFHAYGRDGCFVLLFKDKGCHMPEDYSTSDGDWSSNPWGSNARWWTEKNLKKSAKIQSWQALCSPD
jgi:hypothetical protein